MQVQWRSCIWKCFQTYCSWSSEGDIILSSSTDGPRISSFLQAINALSLSSSVRNFVSELLLADMTRLDLLAANGTVNRFPLRLSPTGLDEAVSAVACGPLAVEEDDDARMGRPAQLFSLDRWRRQRKEPACIVGAQRQVRAILETAQGL